MKQCKQVALVLTQGQANGILELEHLYAAHLTNPTYNLNGLLVGVQGAGVTTVVQTFARKFATPLFTIPATAWIVRGARSQPTIERLLEKLRTGRCIILIEHIDKLRLHSASGSAWFHTVTQELLQVLNGDLVDQLQETEAANFMSSLVVLTGTQSDGGRLLWRPDEVFQQFDYFNDTCIPRELDERLPKPCVIEPPTTEEWQALLRKEFTLPENRIQELVQEAQDQTKGLYFLGTLKQKLLWDTPLPPLQTLLHMPEEAPITTIQEWKALYQPVSELNFEWGDITCGAWSQPGGKEASRPFLLMQPIAYWGMQNPSEKPSPHYQKMKEWLQALPEFQEMAIRKNKIAWLRLFACMPDPFFDACLQQQVFPDFPDFVWHLSYRWWDLLASEQSKSWKVVAVALHALSCFSDEGSYRLNKETSMLGGSYTNPFWRVRACVEMEDNEPVSLYTKDHWGLFHYWKITQQTPLARRAPVQEVTGDIVVKWDVALLARRILHPTFPLPWKFLESEGSILGYPIYNLLRRAPLQPAEKEHLEALLQWNHPWWVQWQISSKKKITPNYDWMPQVLAEDLSVENG